MSELAGVEVMRSETVLEGRSGAAQPGRGDQGKYQRRVIIASGAGALALFLLNYFMRLDHVVGTYVDDAWYVLLAKALATGQGYTLINSPSPGILPLYPPAFPWLLSLVYRLAPQFPQNVWLLKSVSLVATLGLGVAAYRYFVRDRGLPHFVALGIALATVVSPSLIYFATSTVMSECVFTLTQLLTVLVVERCVREGNEGRVWLYALLAAALASFTFLTRSISVVLIIGVVLYLLKERLPRAALVFGAGVVLIVGPWLLYVRAHAPTPQQRMEQGSHIVQSYGTQFWQRDAAESSLGAATTKDLAARVVKNTIRIVRSEIGTVFAFQLTRIVKNQYPRGGEVFVALLSLLAVLGFWSAARERVTLAEIVVPLSLMIIVVWPWPPQRFILPLSPFLIFYVLMGFWAVHLWYQRWRRNLNPRALRTSVGSVIWAVVAINILGNVLYTFPLQEPRSHRAARVEQFGEIEAMFQWIRMNVPQEEVIAAFNPALVNLYTGHKTIFPENQTDNWGDWQRPGVRYMVFTPWHRVPAFERTEGNYRVVYQSPVNRYLKVIELDAKTEETVDSLSYRR